MFKTRLHFFLLFSLIGSASQGAILRVGSKANIENVILGEMATLIAEQKKLSVNHRAGLGGTQIVWKALLRGELDLYPDYTGTLTQELLADKAISSFSELKKALNELGLAVCEPLGFNNTYAIGVTRETAKKYSLTKISDLSKFPELRFGFSNEFMNRTEGWTALRRVYQLPQQNIRALEHEVTYLGLANGAIEATDLYSTDAEVDYYHLVTLEDDRNLFPKYHALFVYRKELEATHPEFIEALKQLSGQLNDAEMTALNAEVKLGKKREKTVAENFLISKKILDPTKRSQTQSALWLYTKQHLQLVLISLFMTILVAVPLGVIASLRPSLGECILGVTGVVQTIPSLALLVFMIPFLGIGAKPALVALFLYGLLPILRNTYTGLREIPHSLIESAEALGLPRWVRLWKVELPLASRSILGGIKTSAVITVGTATLGAIIGAGGYGEPILIGIRKDDISLILQGAIPAALLAILVQFLFQLSEKFLIPRGLRLKAR